MGKCFKIALNKIISKMTLLSLPPGSGRDILSLQWQNPNLMLLDHLLHLIRLDLPLFRSPKKMWQWRRDQLDVQLKEKLVQSIKKSLKKEEKVKLKLLFNFLSPWYPRYIVCFLYFYFFNVNLRFSFVVRFLIKLMNYCDIWLL